MAENGAVLLDRRYRMDSLMDDVPPIILMRHGLLCSAESREEGGISHLQYRYHFVIVQCPYPPQRANGCLSDANSSQSRSKVAFLTSIIVLAAGTSQSDTQAAGTRQDSRRSKGEWNLEFGTCGWFQITFPPNIQYRLRPTWRILILPIESSSISFSFTCRG